MENIDILNADSTQTEVVLPTFELTTDCATVKFTVNSGESSTITAEFTAPPIDTNGYPAYSGHIEITSSSETLRVSYLIVVGSVYDQQLKGHDVFGAPFPLVPLPDGTSRLIRLLISSPAEIPPSSRIGPLPSLAHFRCVSTTVSVAWIVIRFPRGHNRPRDCGFEKRQPHGGRKSCGEPCCCKNARRAGGYPLPSLYPNC
jgi:hypothetical protein